MAEMEKFNYCHVAERTDIGCKRRENQDFMGHFDCENGRIAVVCDGMGGHVGGAEASHIAVSAIEQYLKSHYFEDPREAIRCSISYANEQILQYADANPVFAGMGSTCVMLLVRKGQVYIGSVGDSRVYIIRDNTIRQLTKDQSFVQMLVDAGQISAQEAEHHPRKNEITNALGFREMQPATVLEDAIMPEAGDCFLLCSDGLSNMVSERDIKSIVIKRDTLASQARVNTLVDMARRNGGLDNITVQLVEFAVNPNAVAHDKPATQRWRRIATYGGIVALAISLCVAVVLLFNNGEGEEIVVEESQTIEVLSSQDKKATVLLDFNEHQLTYKDKNDKDVKKDIPEQATTDNVTLLSGRDHVKMTTIGRKISFEADSACQEFTLSISDSTMKITYRVIILLPPIFPRAQVPDGQTPSSTQGENSQKTKQRASNNSEGNVNSNSNVANVVDDKRRRDDTETLPKDTVNKNIDSSDVPD